MIAQLILALAILVSLHEWGHYIAARSFGIRVEKFFIFFDAWGIKLLSKKRGDTEWGIGWLPIGGYVKIAGMIDESLDKDQMATEPKDDEFRGKPAWQRLIVMIGGVTVNFVLGILIFSLYLFHYGDVYVPNQAVVDGSGIMVSELGEKVGLKDGDKILSVNGEKVERFKELSSVKLLLEFDNDIQYEVKRGDSVFMLNVPADMKSEIVENKRAGMFDYRFKTVVAKVDEGTGAAEAGLEKEDRIVSVNGTETIYFDEFKKALSQTKGEEIKLGVIRDGEKLVLDAKVDTSGTIGFRPTDQFEYKGEMDTIFYGFFEAFPAGTKHGINLLGDQISAFGSMIQGKINPVKSLMGPVQMAQLFGSDWNWKRFWNLVGILSLILAFMNLLPIPALDGGHVVFLIVEMIIGRPLPDKFMYAMQIIGMIILFSLMAFIFGVDIFSIFK